MKKLMITLTLWFAVVLSAGAVAETPATGQKKATFAGGCFWCVESDFDKVPGVVKTVSGYIGGTGDNPTYKTYSRMGYIEAVEITYDPSKVSYEKLLDIFWHSVDPTDPGGQFCDRGHAYTTAIFTHDPEQEKTASASLQKLRADNPKKKIVTPIRKATTFFPAETYHQGYSAKNPWRYKYYRTACGRDRRVKQVWGKNAYRGINKE